MVIIRGKRRVISTSKIRKITAIRKNCNENGSRADDFGSNPHSKGEFFSRSENVFFDRMEAIIIIRTLKVPSNIAILNTINIIYTSYRSPNWKLGIIIILYKLASSSVDRNVKE